MVYYAAFEGHKACPEPNKDKTDKEKTMEIKTWIKYEVPYPQSQCRKKRYQKCEEYVNVLLKEVPFSKLVLAYEDKSYGGKGKIYRLGRKLYAKTKMPNLPKEDLKRYGVKTPLDWLLYVNEKMSLYFSSRFFKGEKATREAMIAKANADISKYILVDGVLYEQTCKLCDDDPHRT